jgi:hypothetical protein
MVESGEGVRAARTSRPSGVAQRDAIESTRGASSAVDDLSEAHNVAKTIN